MRKEGILETAHPVTGESRFEAVAKIKGLYTHLGWWSTYAKALKALKEIKK